MRTTATTDRARWQGEGTWGAARPRNLRMAGDASSLRAARHMVADVLAEAPADVTDAAVLLAGEILTNAVVHGGGWFLLHVDADPDRIYVEVADSTPGCPTVLHPSSDREHGRGMAIVDAIASAWGTEQRGSHKAVWFELAREGNRPATAPRTLRPT
jgi:serine/threonine-protein kinase RsbW